MAKKKTITIYDVANQAGVSPRTVSRYFNHPEKLAATTRDAIESIVRKLNFRPNVYANRINRNEQFSVAVMASFHSAEGKLSDLHRLLLSHISCSLCARGQDLLFIGINADNQERVIRESLRQHKFDSLILLTPQNKTILEEISNAPFRVVTLNWEPPNPLPRHARVGIDYYKSSLTYTKALYRRGYRNILYVSPESECKMDPRGQAALAAPKKGCRGLTTRHLSCAGYTDYLSMAKAVLPQILALPSPPDLVYCWQDQIALALLTHATELGIQVPNKLAFAGFDGIEAIAHTTPRLTTAAQPWRQMANAAVELVTGKSTAFQHIDLPITIEWGNSC